ncbi:kinase-like domain-containing protein [Rhizophagus diaphanus]|nr:kinase-like domain-containing protein [Rhizophagus diaphanus] [Rhizophagus sp. MUCL 43196]
MHELDNNLREYLHQNHNKLTWEKRIQIIDHILYGVSRIHKENAIHRDLHSGNILFNDVNIRISDLGFCGPVDKPLNSIYGNLPYIAPEVIVKMKYSFASDVYSIGMLMWEISSGLPPFVYKHNYDLALKIINGMRPRIIPGTPLKYKELMEQCWDADPTKRPDIFDLRDEIRFLYRSYLINENDEQQTNNIASIDNFQLNTNFSISSTNSINSFLRNSSSRVYYFKDLHEPRNATKEEQEAYHSLQFDFDLQDGMITEVKDESNKRNYFNEGQDDLTINPKKVKLNNNNDKDEIYNPNFRSEEQDELIVSNCKMDLNYLLN